MIFNIARLSDHLWLNDQSADLEFRIIHDS
jgi:hypothetical protein